MHHHAYPFIQSHCLPPVLFEIRSHITQPRHKVCYVGENGLELLNFLIHLLGSGNTCPGTITTCRLYSDGDPNAGLLDARQTLWNCGICPALKVRTWCLVTLLSIQHTWSVITHQWVQRVVPLTIGGSVPHLTAFDADTRFK